MKKLLCLILSMLLILPPLPAQAWSEGGLHLIAVMAVRKLPADKREELIRILKAHPRFEQDFKLPQIELPEAYLKNAGAVPKQRAVEAAVRLAGV